MKNLDLESLDPEAIFKLAEEIARREETKEFYKQREQEEARAKRGRKS